MVLATIGGRLSHDLPHLGLKAGHEGFMEVTACGIYWRISTEGKLVLSEELDGEPERTLILTYLDDNIASVWNESLAESELYLRN